VVLNQELESDALACHDSPLSVRVHERADVEYRPVKRRASYKGLL
jgi:hypothetical protein